MKLVADTSILIDCKLSSLVEEKKLENAELIIPVAALDELQGQASRGKEVGFIGLEEIKRLRELAPQHKLKIRFAGERPSLEDIKLAKSGRIDALIRETAKTENATLYTSDYVQALVAEAEGVKTEYIAPEIKVRGLKFEQFFTPDTISVHLKEKVPPLAKRGRPGRFELVKLREEPLSEEELNEIIREITEATRVSEEGNIEISRGGAMVIQLGDFRIAVGRPPFTDGIEITIVRPIVKLTLQDYKLSQKLIRRLEERAEGILIAGPPGSGKTTLAGSLAEFYLHQGKIVKTLESPRDLRVSDEITQYAPLEGSFEKTADILLMVRPDYSVFDEIRRPKDFEVFADLRLAGVGMVGVVHASNAIDAIQRFIGKVELGMIPHVVDTIIFLKDGEVKKVYELGLTVKVPTGMTEADLARPVVEVRDFETSRLEYEIYTFGEENVVVPVKEEEYALKKLAEERIFEEVKKFDPRAEVSLVSPTRAMVRVENKVIPKLIGKGGETVASLEKRLGISLSVEPKLPFLGKEVKFELVEKGNSLEFIFDRRLLGRSISFYANGKFVFSATVGKKGQIKVIKDSPPGKELLSLLASGKRLKAVAS